MDETWEVIAMTGLQHWQVDAFPRSWIVAFPPSIDYSFEHLDLVINRKFYSEEWW